MKEISENIKHDRYIDLLRGLGIIAVVVGHAYNTDNFFSYGTDVVRKFCYFFHLAVFFFCSGYLYKIQRMPEFIKRTVKKWYVPFVLVCLISLILYPLWKGFGVIESLTFLDLARKIKNIILFKNDGLLTGAMWFLIFFAMAQMQYTVLNYLGNFILKKVPVHSKIKNKADACIGVACSILGCCGLLIVTNCGGGGVLPMAFFIDASGDVAWSFLQRTQRRLL